MKKILYFILCLTFMLSATSCYTGDGWQNTPEKALAIEADINLDNLQRLTPTTVLDEFQIGDKVYLLFVSQGESLVQASFVTNEEGQYHYEGDTEEIAIGDPDTMILNGDREQFILFDHFKDETHVWGYKYSSVEITVNGTTPQTKSYTFTCNGKEWSVDRWWLEADEKTEINIELSASSK
ncbi:MAG: hypothetical protein IJW49_05780 [Clostridia bacterium]|nr:hypothetical protein [Clostridia bacterium]